MDAFLLYFNYGRGVGSMGKFCAKCGGGIQDGSSFCGKCGTKITDFSQPIAQVNNQLLNNQNIVNTKNANNILNSVGDVGENNAVLNNKNTSNNIPEKGKKRKKRGCLISFIIFVISNFILS